MATKDKMGALKRSLGRGLRVLVALLLAGLAAQYGDNELYLALAPLLNALAKYAREEFGVDLKIL